jgi:hypothetical protein
MKWLCSIALFLMLIPAINAQVTCPAGAGHCVQLTWTPASTGSAASSFNVYRSTVNGGCSTVNPLPSSCTKINSVTAPTESYIDSPLAASTTYYWVVTAANSTGESTVSNQFQFTTTADVPLPPTGLTGTGK